MVMERLDAAGKHPENQDPVSQFAIKGAKRLLRAAGVVDPGPKEAKLHIAKVLPGADSFIPPHGEVLSPEFAEKVRVVVLQLPADLPFGSLRYWDDTKRREIIRHERPYNTKFVSIVRQLPDAPKEWVSFMQSLAPKQKGVIAASFDNIFRLSTYEGGVSISIVGLETPISNVADKLNSDVARAEWGKSEHFVVAAFRDIALS